MTVYYILRKGKPILGKKKSMIVANTKKQAIESFKELHPRIKGKLGASPILKYDRVKE